MKTNRTIKAHLDRNGIVIYRLMQGTTKPRIVRTYGYGTHHKIWLKLEGLENGCTMMTAETAAFVKEEIAQWWKNGDKVAGKTKLAATVAPAKSLVSGKLLGCSLD